MNRARPLSLVLFTALCVSAVATSLGVAEEGCVYSGSGDPRASVCNALGAWLQTCPGATTGCAAAYTSDCVAGTSALSQPAINAIFYCATTAGVCPSSGPFTSACFDQDVGFETISAAQTKLVQDYCDRCEPGNTACASTFFTPTIDGGVVQQGEILLADDQAVQTIDSQCIPPLQADGGAAACEAAFNACAMPIATTGVSLPPECTGGSTDAGEPADGGSGG